jgi:hypothetical protein
VLSFFVAGIGCGYFLRDHLSNKRRYWSSKRDKQTATPRLLDIKTSRMSDVWRALRNLPPPKRARRFELRRRQREMNGPAQWQFHRGVLDLILISLVKRPLTLMKGIAGTSGEAR